MSTGSYSISTDKDRLDLDFIHRYLSEESYWAKGIPKEVFLRSVRNSLCFGVYFDSKQVGFARIVSDYATYAYLADVFITPAHRGKGLSKQLMETIVNFSELQGLRRWVLA